MIMRLHCSPHAPHVQNMFVSDATLCMQEFELTIDLSSVLKDLDKDRNGVVDYAEFRQLLGGH